MIEREEEILKKQIIVLIVINSLLVLIIGGIFLVTIFQQERYHHPDVFTASFNVTKTHDGWIIKIYAGIKRYNGSGDYHGDYKVELSHLYYVVYNISNGHIYEKGYISSIKNTPSSLGIVFYDEDNNGILSKGDYMFIPRIDETLQIICTVEMGLCFRTMDV